MLKTASVYIRIEPEIKEQAESIFASLGIQASNAISMFYRQVILRGGLPFEIKIPDDKKPMVLRKMTDEEAKKVIIGGLADIENGKIKDANEVLDEIEKDCNL